MGPVVDHRHVRGATMNHQRRHLQLQRAALLHDFLADFEIYLANTFMNDDSQAFHTRTNWAGGGATQIDFLAASLTIPCSSVGIDCNLDFSTDHRMVHGVFETRLFAGLLLLPTQYEGGCQKPVGATPPKQVRLNGGLGMKLADASRSWLLNTCRGATNTEMKSWLPSWSNTPRQTLLLIDGC